MTTGRAMSHGAPDAGGLEEIRLVELCVEHGNRLLVRAPARTELFVLRVEMQRQLLDDVPFVGWG